MIDLERYGSSALRKEATHLLPAGADEIAEDLRSALERHPNGDSGSSRCSRRCRVTRTFATKKPTAGTRKSTVATRSAKTVSIASGVSHASYATPPRGQ